MFNVRESIAKSRMRARSARIEKNKASNKNNTHQHCTSAGDVGTHIIVLMYGHSQPDKCCILLVLSMQSKTIPQQRDHQLRKSSGRR